MVRQNGNAVMLSCIDMLEDNAFCDLSVPFCNDVKYFESAVTKALSLKCSPLT